LKHKRNISPVSRSGRFGSSPAANAARFTESISFDWRLWRHDIAGSIATPRCFGKRDCSRPRELRATIRGLDGIAKEIQSGKFRWKSELEDVHMNIEAELTRRVPAGAKLHTGRSRNDQVALDMRLWLREQILGLGAGNPLLAAGDGRVGRPRDRGDHSRLYAFATGTAGLFSRITCWLTSKCSPGTTSRLQECVIRVNVCPLGSGPSPAPPCRSNADWWLSLLGL